MLKKRIILVLFLLVVGAVFGSSIQLVGACNAQTQTPNPC